MPRKDTSMKVGQVVIHEGKQYQVSSVKDNIVTAHSYDDNCGFDTTIYVSTNTGQVIATKAHKRISRL